MSSQKSELYSSEHSDNQPTPFEHIVIVENNDADLFIQQTLIKNLGLGNKVEKRTSFSEILRDMKAAKRLSEIPNLILMSLQGDNRGGYHFLDQFNALPDFIRDKCKLIIVTAGNSKEEKQNAIMNPSVIRYLEKPIDAAHFRDFMYM